jgi:hypothetical protein
MASKTCMDKNSGDVPQLYFGNMHLVFTQKDEENVML